MKVNELKAQLNKLTQPELIQLLVDCCKSNEDVKNLVAKKLMGSEDKPATNTKSFAAMKEWLAIPEPMRNRLIQNVFCGPCKGVTAIKDFTVNPDKHGIILKGVCKTCGSPVARVIERE
jgi:hypothetical protein